MHWTEKSALEVRAALDIRQFAAPCDADRLLDFARGQGVALRIEREMDCLAEIRRVRGGRWLLKLSTDLSYSLRSDIVMHEIAHLFTLSGMASVCAPEFHWWWRIRDEISAHLWCAHFRIPTERLQSLLSLQPSWEDLLNECQVPEGLLALKLKILHSTIAPEPGFLSAEGAPVLASASLRAIWERESSWQWRVGVLRTDTGERWVRSRAADPARLAPAYYELAWDLVGWSETRFWERWSEELEPVQHRRDMVRWSNPKRTATIST